MAHAAPRDASKRSVWMPNEGYPRDGVGQVRASSRRAVDLSAFGRSSQTDATTIRVVPAAALLRLDIGQMPADREPRAGQAEQ